MRHAVFFVAGLFVLLVGFGPTPGQAQTLRAASPGDSHAAMSGGDYTLRASTGQPGVQILGGDPFLGAGFWFAARNEEAKLPVELAAFNARSATEGVRLTWQTATETGNAGFNVQRRKAGPHGEHSNDGGPSFTKVGFVEGSGTTSEPQTYRFRDRNLPDRADSLVYRLRQVDVDGTAHIIGTVTIGRGTPDEVHLHGPFPSPTRHRATIRYEVPSETDVTLHVYDILGRRVATLAEETAEAGRHVQQADVSGLAAGTYLLRLTAEGRGQTRRLVVIE